MIKVNLLHDKKDPISLRGRLALMILDFAFDMYWNVVYLAVAICIWAMLWAILLIYGIDLYEVFEKI
jgi:hypothetical protein